MNTLKIMLHLKNMKTIKNLFSLVINDIESENFNKKSPSQQDEIVEKLLKNPSPKELSPRGKKNILKSIEKSI